jgi:large subunit ribosomal protein LP2
MKHLAAYLLLLISGNEKPSASDIRGLLKSVGSEADDSRLLQLFDNLRDKTVNEVSTQAISIFQC